MRIVILGLTVTSSWGNGHATTYRGLMQGLTRRGHDVVFLERNQPWYADNRDLPEPPYGETVVYDSLDALSGWAAELSHADLVIVGSFVPDGIAVGRFAQAHAPRTAFYDIDTPVTLAALADGSCAYLTPELLRGYGLYLSFTGGPTLQYLEHTLGAHAARALYCSADPAIYLPSPQVMPQWDMGYLGTYSPDRQPVLDRLLNEPAYAWSDGRFIVAGPQYPGSLAWPANVARTMHLSPAEHRAFYAAQRFTLNVTRVDMVRAGYSPSVRLFEAACCGVPVISDTWPGLDSFFHPGTEIIIAGNATDVLTALRTMPEQERQAIGAAARARVLAAHTGDHRAAELEAYAHEMFARVAA